MSQGGVVDYANAGYELNCESEETMSETHIDGRWCIDLHCSRCYAADTWQNSALTAAQQELAAERERVKEKERNEAEYERILGARSYQEVADEIRTLKDYYSELLRSKDAVETKLAQSYARMEAEREQAALYRWLRVHSWVDTSLIKSVLNFGPGYQQTKPEILDAIIYAAIAGEKEKK